MRRHLLVLLALLALTLAGAALRPAPAVACAGHTLVIGSLGSLREEIVTQILSVLIYQRTGTTIHLERFASGEALYRAAAKGDLDLFVEFSGRGGERAGLAPAPADPAAHYGEVSEHYRQRLGLVWLDPLGFAESSGGQASLAAPVISAHTLKRFPALKRLLNRLGGLLDEEVIAALEVRGRDGDLRRLAQEFLRERDLVFGG